MSRKDNKTNGERRTPSRPSLSSSHGAARSVSFSPEVSVFTNATDKSTEELADADIRKEEALPRSLFSGRWIENVQECNESEIVAIVEVTDHSPSSQSCKEWKQKQYNGDSVKDKLNRMRKRLLQRHEQPFEGNGNHCIPDLASAEETISPLAPKSVNENESNSDFPSRTSPPTNNGKSLGLTIDLKTLNMGDIGRNDEEILQSEHERDYEVGPISRRGKLWARIVDGVRALLFFLGFIVIQTKRPLCGEMGKEIFLTKLGGTFVICCSASLSTRERRRRTGWTKLMEILCARKTFLLLIYIVAWSYTVNAAATLLMGRSITDIHTCTGSHMKWSRISWQPNDLYKLFARTELDDDMHSMNVDFEPDKVNANTISTEDTLVVTEQQRKQCDDETDASTESREEEMKDVDGIPSLDVGHVREDVEKAKLSLNEAVITDVDGTEIEKNELDVPPATFDTWQKVEPHAAPLDMVEVELSADSAANVDIHDAEPVTDDGNVAVIMPGTRQILEPQAKPYEEKATIAVTDEVITTKGKGSWEDLTQETRSFLEPDALSLITDEVSASVTKEGTMDVGDDRDKKGEQKLNVDMTRTWRPLETTSKPTNTVQMQTILKYHKDVNDATKGVENDVWGDGLYHETEPTLSPSQHTEPYGADTVNESSKEAPEQHHHPTDESYEHDTEKSAIEVDDIKSISDNEFDEKIPGTEGELALNTGGLNSAPPKALMQFDHNRQMLSLMRFSSPFLTRTRTRDVNADTQLFDCPSSKLLFPLLHNDALSVWSLYMTEGTTPCQASCNKVALLATFVRRHCFAFLIGIDGKYSNQLMVDSLFEIWASRFWV